MSMENCNKFNDAFIKAFNEAMKTDAGQSIAKDLAMFAFCNGKTTKKDIKKIKDEFVEACFYGMLKESKEAMGLFAECVRKDLRAEA